ncbi:MAG: putative family peptidase [Gemmatimonadetes bacterium]|nr:putative family peptidase [Gemmatimonadota bacterium]
MYNRRLFALALLLAPAVMFAQQGGTTTRALTAADIQAWKNIRAQSLSNDGNWFAYQLAPNDGDAEVVLRSTREGKEHRFQIGEPPAPVAGPPGAAAAGAPLVIAPTSKFVAFTVYPTAKEAKRLKAQRRPSYNKVAVVNVATGEKKEFDKVRRFAFSGEQAGWLAMQAYPAEGSPPAPAAPAPGGAAAAPRVEGTDLLLYNLTTGEMVNVGNVAEFAFDDSGEFLAYTIDARDRLGNGVQLRNMKTDVVKSLDSDRSLYRRLAWADSGPALAVLRGIPDSAAKDTVFTLVVFSNVARSAPAKSVVDTKVAGMPSGMQISADRTPRWAEDFSAVYFGIKDAKKKQPAAPLLADAAANRPSVVQAGAPGAGGAINQPNVPADDDNSSLILWHWKDPRLQSQQIVQEQADKSYSYLSVYRIPENKVIRLADDDLRTVNIAPKDRFAVGIDNHTYQQVASYNGRNYQDIYTIDLKTGERKRALQKHLGSTAPSPDGSMLLYFGMDTSFHVIDMATGQARNITRGVPAVFGDTADDHNNLVPPSFAPMGWSKDGASVLLTDGWDVYKVPTKGGAAVNLTVDGLKTGKHYQRRYVFDSREKGIDFSKPLYFATYGEWTKKEGLARVDARRAGATNLVFEDAKLNFTKARDADTFIFTRQTYVDFPNFYLANATFGSEKQLTDANPQQRQIAWSPGVKLVDYTSAKGDKLQGALFLPANYQPGKKYPMLVTIYEKMSQNMHAYAAPNETRAPNPTLFTSKGYAVLMPDIVYKINDPGMSAVWSVVPAVKAAIATGIADSANVGLWGHSWGGYQTAFLVTQTDIFKSAIAGAPLTDMVSMYSSIYWNTGNTNQGIFESSQGRFTGNFTDNTEAYIRNSPVFHAKNVKTPLIILHNDKDGAVDFNQGVTYYNTLRQLGKEVIMLEYAGENHGLARPVNQKDYAARMGEWFDHYLEDKPAPDWMKEGVPRLRMEEHLRERKPTVKPEPPVVP